MVCAWCPDHQPPHATYSTPTVRRRLRWSHLCDPDYPVCVCLCPSQFHCQRCQGGCICRRRVDVALRSRCRKLLGCHRHRNGRCRQSTNNSFLACPSLRTGYRIFCASGLGWMDDCAPALTPGLLLLACSGHVAGSTLLCTCCLPLARWLSSKRSTSQSLWTCVHGSTCWHSIPPNYHLADANH